MKHCPSLTDFFQSFSSDFNYFYSNSQIIILRTLYLRGWEIRTKRYDLKFAIKAIEINEKKNKSKMDRFNFLHSGLVSEY